ncbi:MAG: hypothetical protein ACO3MW_13910 [Rhodospirillales bacterium]
MIIFLKKAFSAKKKNKKDAKAHPAEATTKQASAPPANEPAAAVSDKNTENNIGPKTEREKLIENALAIHREKSKILDNLPPAVRTKLTAMAMAIYIKQKSDDNKN